jgi:competence protein ComEC
MGQGWTRPVPGALAFALGVGLLFTLPELPAGWALALPAAALAWLAQRWAPMRLPLLLVLGTLWAHLAAREMLCHPFPSNLTNLDLRLEGRVASLPEARPGTTRFQFLVERAWRGEEEADFRGQVRLSWREAPDLRVGERRVLAARLKPPHGFANPGGFDYERWLFQNGILATGYVREEGDLGLLDPGPGPFWLDRWRQGLGERLGASLGDSPVRGVMLALVLGERAGISTEQWAMLTRTGVNHLVAISGLHVGLVAASTFFLVRRAWSRRPGLALRLAAPRAGALGGLAAALIYSGLAGFAVSTQRALIMLTVILVALLWARTPRLWTGLVFALAAVLLLDPLAVLSYGFWLSFGAVAALLLGLGHRLPATDLWSRWGRAQWVVTLGLLPLLLLLFGRASLISPAVNLVAVPFFGLLLPLVLVTAALALITGLAWPWIWTADLVAWLLEGLSALASWPWAALSLSGRPDWTWVAAFGGALLLLAPRGLPGRWLGLPLLLPLALLRPPAPAAGDAWFDLLDVGQGLAAVVRTADGVLVFDTGPAFAGGFNTGEAVVAPFLREMGVNGIDILVLSHGDRDHAGGLAGLTTQVPIGLILAGEPQARAEPEGIRTGGPPWEPCQAGWGWEWSGVRFSILHPPGQGREGNEASCVMRVDARGASLLITGDLGWSGERQLAREIPLASTLLVAGHHGSNTSTSAELLAAVRPRWVLYSSGFANRYGFPATKVRERVRAGGAAELNTAETGAIGFVLSPTGLTGPSLYREEHRRLWSWRPAVAEDGDGGGGLATPSPRPGQPP